MTKRKEKFQNNNKSKQTVKKQEFHYVNDIVSNEEISCRCGEVVNVSIKIGFDFCPSCGNKLEATKKESFFQKIKKRIFND